MTGLLVTVALAAVLLLVVVMSHGNRAVGGYVNCTGGMASDELPALSRQQERAEQRNLAWRRRKSLDGAPMLSKGRKENGLCLVGSGAWMPGTLSPWYGCIEFGSRAAFSYRAPAKESGRPGISCTNA